MRAALITLCCLVAVAHAAPPREQLDKARDAFRKKDCGSAMPPLKDVLYPVERLADRDSLFEARAMLGACFADGGDRDQAKVEFEKALQLKPREVLDSLYYSERAVRLFDDTKADIENRAKKDEELRKLQEKNERIEQLIANTRTFRENYYALNFVPFGAGQFQNRQYLKAGLFGGAQLATLGTSLGIWFYLVNRYGIRSTHVPLEDGPSVRRYQQIEIGTGLAFFGLWVWSSIDALRHYKPKIRVENDEELLKQIKQEATDKKLKKPTSFYKRLHLSPMVTSDGVGIGIGWEND
jgi:tetratricopeptide (TPR) repeat protein